MHFGLGIQANYYYKQSVISSQQNIFSNYNSNEKLKFNRFLIIILFLSQL